MHKLVIPYFLFISSLTYASKTGANHLQQARKYLFNNPDSTAYHLQKASLAHGNSQKDSCYAELLCIKGISYSITGNVDDALTCFIDAYYAHKKLENKEGLSECLINIGEIYYNWGEYDKAHLYFIEGYEMAKRAKATSLQIKGFNYIGKYYHSKGDFEKSYFNYQKALTMAVEHNDTVNMIALYNKIGKHFKTLGSYAKSLEYFLKSENLISHTNNKIEIATTYNHLGNIYQELEDYNTALGLHKQALKARQEMNYKEGIAKSFKNLGEVYIDLEQLDSALYCFKKSHILCEEVGYAKGLIKNIFNQGIIYKMQGRYVLATEKFNESLTICKKIGYTIGEIKAIAELAEVFTKQQKIKAAIDFTKQGLDIAIEENMKASESELYHLLYTIYTKEKQYEKALFYYKKHAEVDDEILNFDTNQKIAELRAEYEISIQNRENEVLKKENEINELVLKRKNTYILFAIIVLALLLFLVVGMYFLILQKKKANKELKLLNNQILTKNKELDSLNKKLSRSKKQQVKLFSIISHELRNPIFWFRNLIQMLSSRIDYLEKDMILKSLNSLNESATNTFHLMDNLLHWSRSQLGNIKYTPEPVNVSTLITDNVKLISHYAAYKNIVIKNKVEQQVWLRADKVMLQTVIRNLLSNAVKFTPSEGTIAIDLVMLNDMAQIQVKDSGPGMDKTTLKSILNSSGTSYIPSTDKETGNGLGLALSKEFIELNGGKLNVKSRQGQGSIFEFTVPLIFQMEYSGNN